MAEDVLMDTGTAGVEAPPADVRVEGEPLESTPEPAPHWMPEQYRENPSVNRYASVEEFINGALEREKLIGRTVQPPAGDASTEDRISFLRKSFDLPQDISDYGVEPLGTAEGMPQRLDSEALLHVMYNNGVPQFAADAIMRHIEQAETAHWEAGRTADEEQQQAAIQALEQRWGAAFVERNLAIGVEGLKREFGNLDWLVNLVVKDSEGNERLLENTPEFAEMAYQFARARGHDRFVPGGQGLPTTVQAARDQLAQGRRDVSEGKLDQDDYNAMELRLAPIAYGMADESDEDDVRIGHVITSVDFEDTQ